MADTNICTGSLQVFCSTKSSWEDNSIKVWDIEVTKSFDVATSDACRLGQYIPAMGVEFKYCYFKQSQSRIYCSICDNL